MPVDFKNSKTKDNLMRAFAGESQARARYTISAGAAKNQKLQVVEAIFIFTANQEKEHGEVFYKHLQELSGESILVDGKYPVDLQYNVAELLRAAQHGELQEFSDVYPSFGEIAKEEGFTDVAASFNLISKIEKIHADRFGMFAELLEQNKLFISDISVDWMCLNCGHVFNGKEVPEKCPVCDHDKGYFIRLELAPYIA